MVKKRLMLLVIWVRERYSSNLCMKILLLVLVFITKLASEICGFYFESLDAINIFNNQKEPHHVFNPFQCNKSF